MSVILLDIWKFMANSKRRQNNSGKVYDTYWFNKHIQVTNVWLYAKAEIQNGY
jgi:hypothetical protein